MNILWLIATMFGLFLLEGTAVQLFEPKAWGMDQYSITPRFVLVAVIFIALYLGRRRGLWFGFAFGLMQDILYSDVIGVYAFSMAFTGYFSGLAFLLFHPNLILLLVTIMGCTILHELIVYGFFHLFGIARRFPKRRCGIMRSPPFS